MFTKTITSREYRWTHQLIADFWERDYTDTSTPVQVALQYLGLDNPLWDTRS